MKKQFIKSIKEITVRDIHKFAFGALRLKPREYFNMEPWLFDLMVEGHFDERNRILEHDRQFAFVLVSPHSKETLTYEKFKSLWRMPYDNYEQVAPPSSKQMNAIRDLHMKRITLQQYNDIVNAES